MLFFLDCDFEFACAFEYIHIPTSATTAKVITTPQPTTQSDPDLQTALPQARNISSGCNAALFLYQSIGFAI